MPYMYELKFRMLQPRENEISLRKWSAGTARFRTLEGTLVMLTEWSLDNNHTLTFSFCKLVLSSQSCFHVNTQAPRQIRLCLKVKLSFECFLSATLLHDYDCLHIAESWW